MTRNPWRFTVADGDTTRELTLRGIAGELLQNAYSVAINPPIFVQPAPVYLSRLVKPLEAYISLPGFPDHWRTRLEALAAELAEEIAAKSTTGTQELGAIVLNKAKLFNYTIVRTTSIRLVLKWKASEGIFQHETISQSEAAALLPGPFDYYYEENQSAQFFELSRRMKLTGRIMFRRRLKYSAGDIILWADVLDPNAVGRDMSFAFRKITYLGRNQ